MAVTRTSVGAFNAGTASVTVAFGAGATAGDLGLLFVETANQALPSTPSGWTQEVQAGIGSAGAAGATMLSVYSKQNITAGDISGGVATGDSVDHQGGRLVTYSGYDTTTPIVVTQSGQDTSTSSTSVILSTAVNSTTITANDIALAAVATDKDIGTSSTNAAQTWNNIAGSRSNIINNSTINGQGGGLIVDELVPSGSQSAAVTFTETITASAWIGRIIVVKASSGSVALTGQSTVWLHLPPRGHRSGLSRHRSNLCGAARSALSSDRLGNLSAGGHRAGLSAERNRVSLIVEDGTGLATAESYISVADADTRQAALGITNWATLSTAEKEQALRRSTRTSSRRFAFAGTATAATSRRRFHGRAGTSRSKASRPVPMLFRQRSSTPAPTSR
jgi:hypothetical protein